MLDGAMGTMIQTYGLSEADYRGTFTDLTPQQTGNNDLLCLTRPDIIADIHRRYVAAGADIITTNTFNAQRISLADYGCQHLVADINRAAVRIAREAADGACFVVASIGPTNKSLSMSPDINDPARRSLSFDNLVNAYAEQMAALVEAGVDALLIETIFDTLNAKAAIYAAEKVMQEAGKQVPLMLSATVSDRAGRLLSGQTLEAFIISVAHAPLLSIGLNCSFGAEDMLPHLRQLRQAIERMSSLTREPIYISAYPNAGLPNQLGQYDETPERMARHILPFIQEGLVDIIGGCCGTTDKHIREMKKVISTTMPQPAPSLTTGDGGESAGSLSGLSPLHFHLSSFINVGERCNVAGSRKFLRLIKEKNYDAAIAIARQQVEDGALALDINLDDGLLDAEAEMCHFLRLLAAEPEVCVVPFMVDSSRWEVIRAALGCIQGKSIVNSISLKEGEEVFISRASEIRRMGAAVIVMAFDEEGQATTYERRIAICQRAYRLLTEQVGFPPQDIIFDPNVLAIATGMPEHDRYALDFIRATAWIKQHLPGAHVSGGVSNLSFSFRGNNPLREAMHAVFLYHARQAGMDMAIVNPSSSVTYADIPPHELQILEDAILARTPNACERLIEMATELKEEAALTTKDGTQATKDYDASAPAASVASRLITALRTGITDNLEADLTEALTQYPSALDIIQGPLMEGMTLVGQLFGEGKMFLPQVVKTARTMKRAVELLQPHLHNSPHGSQGRLTPQELSTSSSPSSPRILIATVKGDVHDIGKNIVATIMACNGYEVIDLGVMVPADTIVAKALELKPDAIGLSGLITPSLEEMVHTVHLLDEAGIRVPVMIGGATTSALHTALKIAPAYHGPVLHVCDASQNVPLAEPFLHADTAAQAFAQLSAEQASLRAQAEQHETATLHSLEEARANKPKFF